LGTTRAPTLQINSQGQPPSRKPAQAQQSSATGKGRAVITANGTRQAVLFEELFKTGSDRFRARVRDRLYLQTVGTEFITHRKRPAALTFPFIPPSFEINRPDLVGFVGLALRP